MTMNHGATGDAMSCDGAVARERPVSREELAAEARRLRKEGLSVAQIRERLGAGRHAIERWTADIPVPEWTRRPRAKDDLRARAIEMREAGASVNDIVRELGVSKSTAWLWVKHLPVDFSDRRESRAERSRAIANAYWEPYRQARDASRAAICTEAAIEIGALTPRELLLIGTALYWAEGAKAKPWRSDCRISFINSDPAMIRLYLRFLGLLGVGADELTFRISIHESADVTAATVWWGKEVGVPADLFRRPTLKRHNPSTKRRNTEETYHGCLTVVVRGHRETFWRIGGMIAALAAATDSVLTNHQADR